MRQASLWYRAESDPESSIRDLPQMIASADILPDTLASLNAQGFRVQRVTVETLCDRCQGVGRVHYRPKGWRKAPRNLLPQRECPECKGAAILASESIL